MVRTFIEHKHKPTQTQTFINIIDTPTPESAQADRSFAVKVGTNLKLTAADKTYQLLMLPD